MPSILFGEELELIWLPFMKIPDLLVPWNSMDVLGVDAGSFILKTWF
jgi:hypothetical protein